MREDITVQELTTQVEKASTEFEKCDSDLKRKYIIWNIEVFNSLAARVSVSKGSFGTGYPFYALDKKLEGKLPVIPEQIRYNRQLVRDGQPVQKSIWLCKECLDKKYSTMPDLKRICKPCPNVLDELKPRKIINRLQDIDMWIVCEDGSIEITQRELTELFRQYDMRTSDLDPIRSIDEVSYITEMVKNGVFPKIFLPIDAHIIEYSELKGLIERVPGELERAGKEGIKPYLPIHPKSYRKTWQYDDEAYNYIYDYLSAFTPFNFEEDLQKTLDTTRAEVAKRFSKEQLFSFLLDSATKANFRRFQTEELEQRFYDRISDWQGIDINPKLEDASHDDEEVAR